MDGACEIHFDHDTSGFPRRARATSIAVVQRMMSDQSWRTLIAKMPEIIYLKVWAARV
jgi:hypothetical protein